MFNATHYHLCDADPDRRYVWFPIAIDPATIDAMGLSPRSPCFVCESVTAMLGEPSASSASNESRVSLDTLPLDARLAALSKRRKEAMANGASASKKSSFVRDTGHHVCHAMGCTVKVPPRMLMCLRHWKMVPKALQQRIWATYVPGQEQRKDPTDAYMEAQRASVQTVAEKEGKATAVLKRKRGAPHPDQAALFKTPDTEESE